MKSPFLPSSIASVEYFKNIFSEAAWQTILWFSGQPEAGNSLFGQLVVEGAQQV